MNSTFITSLVVLIMVFCNLLSGYAFAKMRFRGRNLIFLLVLSTMTVPVQVLMVPQCKLDSAMGMFGSFWAVIVPASSTAFGVFLARQFMLGIPDEVIEAARMDGAGQLGPSSTWSCPCASRSSRCCRCSPSSASGTTSPGRSPSSRT